MSPVALASLLGAHAAAFALLWLVCFAAGDAPLRTVAFRSLAERVAVATTVGLGILGTLLFLVGLAGLLYPAVVLLFAVTVLTPLVLRLRSLPRHSAISRTRLIAGADLVLLLVWVLGFLLSAYPPAAFDATTYHLPLAKLFAHEHAVVVAETLRFPVFPLLNEMAFTAVTMFAPDRAMHLVQLLAFTTTALLVYAWAERWFGRPAGIWAAAIWGGNPLVLYLAGSGYIDVGLTLFVTASLLFWARWREGSGTTWLVLSAASAGCAAGSKYHGLVMLALVGTLTIFRAWSLRSWRAAVVFTLISGAAASPWYLRNLVETGNPVFPFLSSVFGPSLWSTRLDEAAAGSSWAGIMLFDRARGVLEAPASAASWLWRISLDPATLGGHPPLSPFYFLLAPLAGVALIRNASPRAIAGAAVVYGAFMAGFDVRFVMPALPVIGLLIAGGLLHLALRRPLMMAIAALLLVSPSLLWSGHTLREWGPPPVTPEARDRYLARRIPAYGAVLYLNETRGAGYTVYAFAAEEARFYATGRFLGEQIGPWAYDRLTNLDSASLWRMLRADGVEFLLLDRNRASFPPAQQPAFRRFFERISQSGGVEIYALRGEDSR